MGARMSLAKILIANRGEIACRVIRTARAMGYRTVAVHSDADAAAPHVALADEAVRIGPPPAVDSYLSIAAVLDAARRTGADAVHPGYGFLSERADFASACVEAGLVFIGPPACAIAAMGDKAGAKRRMLEAGVPCAPGFLADDTAAQSDERLIAEASRLGYPLLVKAVAGGGGRGMRLVHAAGELPAALAGARREAEGAFGDGRLMLERLIENGRHIEIQVFADAHGHVVHLGERDCTAQRRRQKVIEESPSPVVTPALRERMGADAVAAARAVGYVGAGTVEFIVDAELKHYFLEMNTRLQVEHPVTEFVAGVDLVEWQLRVAAGEPLSNWLPRGQEDVRFEGHAIEARLYAEDPYEAFRPQTGTILHWQPAHAVEHGRSSVRIDDGIVEGSAVSPWYDALLAKLIVHGRDRADAIRRLVAALDVSPLLGLQTNARFLGDLLQHEDFTAARLSTTRIDDWAREGADILQRPLPDECTWLSAAALAARGSLKPGATSGLRPAALATQSFDLQCGGQTRRWRVRLDDDAVELAADGVTHRVRILAGLSHSHWRLEIDGIARTVVARGSPDGSWHVAERGADFVFAEPSARPNHRSSADPCRAAAPVTGIVTQVLVRPGDRVEAGQPMVCVEAMKMEMWLNAQAAGIVRAVHAREREPVAAGTLVVELEIGE
ncbi:biotin carboxylase N-terminal domain-containing protein [Ideonella sp. YS5]|uniref:acetyl/propionyl/methylcrotonyl-CoA carboxylase subunit alpha n=1 Tax=Ideonella sp. YS5 TaxID=3453714 RepID=UPI003EEF5571